MSGSHNIISGRVAQSGVRGKALKDALVSAFDKQATVGGKDDRKVGKEKPKKK